MKIFILSLFLTTYLFGQGFTTLGLLMGDENGYDTDAKVYFDAMATPLSDEQQERINAFVVMLKDSLSISSLSGKFDVMYLLANETSEAGLKNLVKRSNDATAVGAPTFTQWQGYTGAIDKSINTNYNPSTEAVKATQNSTSVGAYVRGMHTAGIKCIWGCETGAVINIFLPNRGSGGRYWNINTAYASVLEDYTDNDFYVVSRTASDEIKLYQTGALLRSGTTVTTGVPNSDMYILSDNDDGTPGAFSTGQVSLFFIGEGLNATEVRKITNCAEVYMDAIGTGVIP